MGRAGAGPGAAAVPLAPRGLCQDELWIHPGELAVPRGVRRAQSRAVGDVSPLPNSLSLPHVATGSRASPWSSPQHRQQLSWTLFWMFMGFQFTPSSEAAKPPSQGAGNPPRLARRPCVPAEEGFQSLASLSSWLRNSAFVRGSLPRLKNLQQIKILMGTYSVL